MTAQRIRMDAISGNMANVSTTRNEKGEPAPYQPRFVIFATDDSIPDADGGVGVSVQSVETAQVEPRYKFQPGTPTQSNKGRIKATSPIRISTSRPKWSTPWKPAARTKPTWA